MALLTAKELRNRENPSKTIDIGGGNHVMVRRPDLPTLVYEGLLPMPLLSAVVKSIATWVGAGNEEVTADMIARDDSLRKFVDRWVCCAVVRPRVVPQPDDPTQPVPDDAVVVTELTLATRSKIFKETFSFGRDYAAAAEAAQRFPDGGSGEGVGPNVQEVLPETVDAAGNN